MPTENELKLLKYFHRSVSASFWVVIVDFQYYEICNYRSSKKTIQIPCTGLALQVRPLIGTVLFYYPSIGSSKSALRTQVRNLRIFILEVEAHLKSVEEQKVLARNAKKERMLRLQQDYSGMSMFDEERLD